MHIKREKNSKSKIMMVVAIVLMLTITVGTTVAFLVAGTNPILNIFNPSQVTTAVVEESTENGTITNVKIANTNNTQAYIRAAVVVTWQNEAGEVYAQQPVVGTDYTIDWVGITDNSWDAGNDGYYYYTQPVDPVKDDGTYHTTSTLFSGFAQLDSANVPADGYYINVEVLGSGIQSTPTSVVANEWGVTVNGTAISK